MPQAQITINAVIGSDEDLPINTLVQFDNNNIGGELTFNWTILDQPAGPADALSNATIQNPTLTPLKEGTYLVKLVVNQGLPDEQEDIVVAAVLDLKTRERFPAAGETIETDSRGWADDLNSLWRRTARLLADNGVVVGEARVAGLVPGAVVRISDVRIIKATLPGEEDVAGFTRALAATAGDIDELLGIVIEGVDGSGTPALGELIRIRVYGLVATTFVAPGAVLGNSVFVSNTGTISLTAGTNRRIIGHICQVGVPGANNFRIWCDGSFAESGNQGAAPPLDVDKSAALVGASGLFARQDHKHNIVTAVPGDIVLANAEGASAALARADHAHRGQFKQRVVTFALFDTTTTSAVFVLLATMPITLTSPGFFDFIMSVAASNSSNNTTIDFEVRIDGTPVGGGFQLGCAAGAGSGQTGAKLFSASRAPGAHSITIHWRTSGGTARIRPVAAPGSEHLFATLLEVNF